MAMCRFRVQKDKKVERPMQAGKLIADFLHSCGFHGQRCDSWRHPKGFLTVAHQKCTWRSAQECRKLARCRVGPKQPAIYIDERTGFPDTRHIDSPVASLVDIWGQRLD